MKISVISLLVVLISLATAFDVPRPRQKENTSKQPSRISLPDREYILQHSFDLPTHPFEEGTFFYRSSLSLSKVIRSNSGRTTAAVSIDSYTFTPSETEKLNALHAAGGVYRIRVVPKDNAYPTHPIAFVKACASSFADVMQLLTVSINENGDVLGLGFASGDNGQLCDPFSDPVSFSPRGSVSSFQLGKSITIIKEKRKSESGPDEQPKDVMGYLQKYVSFFHSLIF